MMSAHAFDIAAHPGSDTLAQQVLHARTEIETCLSEASSIVLGASATVSDLGSLVEPLGTLVENLRAAEELSIRMGEAMQSEAEHMQTVSIALQKVSQPVDQLDRVIRTVGLVALNARVAAGSSGSKKHIQFVEDIRALAIEAQTRIKDVGVTLADVAESLRAVGQTQQAFRDGYADRLGGLIAVEKSQQEFLKHFARDAEAAANLATKISAQATDGYGDLAMALFAGDAASQRLQHVATALSALRDGDSPARALQYIQITAALADFDHNLARISRAHSSLTSTVEHFKDLLASMVRRQGATDGQLPYLKKSLSRAMAVLNASQAQRRDLDVEINNVANKLENLFHRIGDLTSLEKRLQLVSLNLSINCQAGSGEERTLATIAGQMMELAAFTRRHITELFSGLEHVKSRTREFRRASERDTVGEIGHLGESTAGPLRSLDAVLGKFELEERLWEAVADLDRSGDRLLSLKAVSSTLARAVPSLHEMRKGSASAADRAELDHLRAGYSMQVEREIHDKFMSKLFSDYSVVTPQEDVAPKLELF